MRIIKPTVELLSITPDAEKLIEKAGRTCYKSEDKITDDSAEKFCKMIQTRDHMSVLEHASATFRITTDRGVTHEIVRHRIAAYSQESTRYCNYSSDKKGMIFVEPEWILNNEDLHTQLVYAGQFPRIQKYTIHTLANYTKEDIFNDDELDNLSKQLYLWLKSCEDAEWYYNTLIDLGQTPQQARAVLPNCLKTEIVMTANFREWLHFLELRTSPQAHPDMRIIAGLIGAELAKQSPTIFEKYEI